jgi:hypothetical protein
LRLCEAIRAHVKGLLHVNLKSWLQGHPEAE